MISTTQRIIVFYSEVSPVAKTDLYTLGKHPFYNPHEGPGNNNLPCTSVVNLTDHWLSIRACDTEPVARPCCKSWILGWSNAALGWHPAWNSPNLIGCDVRVTFCMDIIQLDWMCCQGITNLTTFNHLSWHGAPRVSGSSVQLRTNYSKKSWKIITFYRRLYL